MVRQPSGEQWPIAAAGYVAVIVELGGGLRSCEAGGQPIVDGYAAEEKCAGGAGQVLAPWPNRVRDGKWDWEGVGHQLALSEPAAHNAIHGLTRWRPWTLVSRSADSVTVQCQVDPQPGYPFSVLVSTTWSLSADGLAARHSAVNNGREPAPFGLGVHPYLMVNGVGADDLVLQVPADTALRTDDRGLPVEEYAVAGSDVDYRAGHRIGPARIDTAFTGGVSGARVSAGGRGVELTLDDSFRWLQVFTGDTLPADRRRRSVAVEPMTCPPDAFNSRRDVVVLQPDQQWQGAWGLRAVTG